jgi:pimeloyl-ACP methyl ester carboxylesterase
VPAVSLPTGVTVHYEDVGEGEPVLLVMGTGADHSFWEVTVAAYRDHHRVITYDNRGTGQSSCPEDPESYTMRVLADDAAALLDAIGVESAHVSGLSLGSTVAQELAINHPDKVRTVQLHCTWGRTDEWLRRMFTDMAYPLRHGDLEHFVQTAFMWVMSPTYLAERPEDVAAIERAYLLENPHPPTVAGLLGHLHADLTHDAIDRVGRIRAPALITAGEVDWQVPIRYGRAVHERMPGSRFHVFTGPYSSHMAYVELADEFNELTLAFLASHARSKEAPCS